MPEDHPLARRGGPAGRADLAGLPLVMHSPIEARYFYDLVVGLVPIAHQNVAHTVSQILTMVWLVAAGRGVAFVPESATGLGISGVAFLPIDGLPESPVELHLIWRRDSRNPALRRVLEAWPPEDTAQR